MENLKIITGLKNMLMVNTISQNNAVYAGIVLRVLNKVNFDKEESDKYFYIINEYAVIDKEIYNFIVDKFIQIRNNALIIPKFYTVAKDNEFEDLFHTDSILGQVEEDIENNMKLFKKAIDITSKIIKIEDAKNIEESSNVKQTENSEG